MSQKQKGQTFQTQQKRNRGNIAIFRCKNNYNVGSWNLIRTCSGVRDISCVGDRGSGLLQTSEPSNSFFIEATVDVSLLFDLLALVPILISQYRRHELSRIRYCCLV